MDSDQIGFGAPLLQYGSYINIRSQLLLKPGTKPVHLYTTNTFPESRYLPKIVLHVH